MTESTLRSRLEQLNALFPTDDVLKKLVDV